jgi:hypothetical protein
MIFTYPVSGWMSIIFTIEYRAVFTASFQPRRWDGADPAFSQAPHGIAA